MGYLGVQLRIFTLDLDGSEWSALRPVKFRIAVSKVRLHYTTSIV
jgi:hypothetical protein